MAVLDRKLARDLWKMRTQALAIALVMAAGAATLILAVGAYQSLYDTREAYYGRYRFADIFASATRAPRAIVEEVRAIPGVAAAEARVAGAALIDVEGMVQPATGRVLSLPDAGRQGLNALFLQSGRLPDPRHADEVVVNAAFAEAHGLRPGDRLDALVHGSKRDLVITGLAHSPEFIYAISPGDLVPDDRRFAVLWMTGTAAEAAFDMKGAFNDLVVGVLRSADEAGIIDRIDTLLEGYGGRGAYTREDQLSHAFLDAELQQLDAMARVMPPIFLAVAAFLINMILGRIVAMEREQIGLLKAIGYGRAAIGGHYLKFALVIALAGLAIGAAGGTLLGRGLTQLYAEFFRFPFLYFTRSPDLYVTAGLVTLGAGALGALRAVWSVGRLPPAVAMAPAPPPRFGHTLLERARLLPRVSQLSMMVVRQLLRWPLKAAATSFGLALAVGLLVGSLFSLDSIEVMIDTTFFRADRQDATLAFSEVEPLRAVEDVRHVPGVLQAEPFRSVPVRLTVGHRERRTSLIGKPADASLSRILDTGLDPVAPPTGGIALSETLASALHVGAGGTVEMELLEKRGRTVEVPVSEVVQSYVAVSAVMELGALNRLLDEGRVVSGVHFGYDRAREDAMFETVKDLPAVASVTLQRAALEGFRQTLADNIVIMTMVYLGLAGVIAFGVVYNSARVRLSERARELASLRVLGFTKSEVYWVLFAEFAVLVLAAIPVGWVIGYGLAAGIVAGLESELYRMPLVIGPDKYAGAALVVIAAAAVSALVVRRQIGRLDLVGVLKTRE